MTKTAAMDRIDTSWIELTPELDAFQAGALRRILNIAGQLPGDWSGMMSADNFGEDFGALRFQIAYMSYALAVAHVNRLPAAPGVFQTPFDSLIRKILSPDCWVYWSHVSTGMGPFNKHLGELPRRWDPVAEDNIMYSAYVQSMTLIYHYLFRDPKYAQPGGITFELTTKFWHEGGFRFPYDERSLNDLIYWQMAEQGFLGVACEPNCIFQICNQPNLIGFRMHDLIYGGDLAEQASEGYVKAWEEFGMLDPDGHFLTFMLADKRTPIPTDAPNMNFWLMTLLHAWYPDIVERQYPVLLQRYLKPGPDGTSWIKPMPRYGSDPGAQLAALDMSWAACCASEIGDAETLTGLLGYADRFMNPVCEDGAYYYKRRDANFDAHGNFIGMDPMSGNALYSYARLNVKDGLKTLYEGPWDDRHFAEPALIGLPPDLDVLRAIFDDERQALALTLGKLPAERPISLELRVPETMGAPAVLKDGRAVASRFLRTAEGLRFELDHGPKSTLVFQW